jgi:autotransporter-associated beta strand protein
MNGGTGLTSGKVISLDAPQTITTLNLNPNWSQVPAFTIGSAADVAAGNTLTVTTVTKGGPNTGDIQTIRANVILGANSTWDILQGYGGNNTHVVVSGVISGSGMSLTKTSNGLLKLYGANTYTGGTAITGGTLQLGDGAALTGSVVGDIANGGALVFNNPSTVTAANITGTGSLTKSGAGTLIFGGSTSATSSGSFTITAGGLDTALTGLVLGSSSHAWNGDFTYVGTQDLDLGAGAVSMDANRTVTVKEGTLAVGGAISGSGRTLAKNGDGTLLLRAAGTYTGATTVNGGTLKIVQAGKAGTAGLTVNNDGQVLLDNTGANADRIADAGAVALLGRLSLLGNASASSSETMGALTAGAGASGITLTPGSGQSALLTFASLAGRNTGATGLYRGTGLGSALGADTANIVFAAAPSVSAFGPFAATDGIGALGGVNAAVLRGVLFDDSAAGIGTGFATYDAAGNGVRLLNSATEQTATYAAGTANVRLDLVSDVGITGAAGNTLQIHNTSGSAKVVTNSGSGLIPHNGLLFTGTSPITLTGGTLNANLDAANKEAILLAANPAGTLVGTAISGDNVTIGGAADITLAGTITAATYGNGYIRVNNGGTTTLGATTTGALVLNDGILRLTTGGKLYEGGSEYSSDKCYVNVNRRARLDLNGISAKSNGIRGSGVLTNSAETLATLTCDWRPSGNNYFTYSPDLSGSIGGNVKLSITGSGYYINKYTQVLSGNNTFTGGIALSSAGMALSINSPTALGTGPLTIGGSKLDSNGQILTTNNEQSWNSSFAFKGSGNLDMGAGAVTLGTANPTVTVEAKKLTIGGAIGEGAAGRGFTKAGVGTLVLNGACTYTGATAVNAGTLAVGGSLGSGNVPVASGAALTLNGNDVISDEAQLTVASGGVVNLNNTVPDVVKKLTLGGVEQPANGTYGAPGSGATYEIAGYFTGTGKIGFPPSGTVVLIR